MTMKLPKHMHQRHSFYTISPFPGVNPNYALPKMKKTPGNCTCGTSYKCDLLPVSQPPATKISK